MAFGPRAPLAPARSGRERVRSLIAKTLVVWSVRTVVDKAVQIVGGGAYFRRSRLERLWRDVQAAQFHPLPESKHLVFTGRVAMGPSPVRVTPALAASLSPEPR